MRADPRPAMDWRQDGLVHRAKSNFKPSPSGQGRATRPAFSCRAAGLGRPLRAIRRSNAGHHPNAKLSRAPTELVEKPVPNVIDDFPEILPVLQRELDIIETYLGATLDQLLSELE